NSPLLQPPRIKRRITSRCRLYTGKGSFFFQAEDGIRDKLVTGFRRVLFRSVVFNLPNHRQPINLSKTTLSSAISIRPQKNRKARSEERRVGKERKTRREEEDEKKKA